MMDKRKLFSGFITVCMSALLLCGCAPKKELADPYRIPDGGLVQFVSTGENLFPEGFASDLCVPLSDGDLSVENVNAEAFGLFDVHDAEVLSQHNLYERVYPASTTKILTCLIALERGDPEMVVTVPSESDIQVAGSSMADLKPGDQLKLKDLLRGLMVPSGNDAAVAIAHCIGGDTESFSRLMNARAKELGAVHSHFVNPHGLPDADHYTTVYDMYLIFQEALKNPQFMEIAGTKEYSCKVTNPKDAVPEREITWTSSNGFYTGKFDFTEGMEILCGKTGHTNAAGFCLVLGEKDREGHRYISIIMKSAEYENLYRSMRNLAGKAFD